MKPGTKPEKPSVFGLYDRSVLFEMVLRCMNDDAHCECGNPENVVDDVRALAAEAAKC